MKPPTVAIITRTKNRPLMIPRCVESVLTQEHSDWIHVIVNDGGDPSELEGVLAPFQERYAGRLKVIHHSKSQGMQHASNAGIEASQSEFIAIHDDDDSWEPAFLRRCLERLSEHTARAPGKPAGGVITQIHWIVEEIRDEALVEVWRGDYLPIADVGVLDAFRRNPTAPIAFLYRREAHERLGLYEQQYDVLGDWVFLLALIKETEVLTVEEKLANYHWRKADADTPEKYANTVTAGLAHHLELRNRFVNEKLREALRAVPALEGPLLALAQPILDTAEATKAIEERLTALASSAAHQASAAELREIHAALRAQIAEARDVQLETLNQLGAVREDLARAKERDYWIQKALDKHSVQLDFIQGTVKRHSAELHETRAKARSIFKRLRRWEFLFTRDPELHDARTEIIELNQDPFDAIDSETDAACIAAARHWMATVKVVSFDVFDTALLRTCGDPMAVFELISQTLPKRGVDYPGFRRHRVEAEHEVRTRNDAAGIGDVTLDEIYAQMVATHGLPAAQEAAVKALELEQEASTLVANPSILQLVQEALKAGKQVIFVSDMYLSGAQVTAFLAQAGFPECPIFISSEEQCTKHTGALYRVVREKLGITQAEILHLGDNRHSDFEMARKEGIRAIHWQGFQGGWPLAEQVHPFATWRERALPSRLAWGLTRVRRARVTHADRHERFWEMVGYEVAGPVYYHFLSWVIGQAQADGVKNLFFLSRDGYYLTRAFDLIRERRDLGALQGHYLYASRRLYNLATRGYLDAQILEFLLSPNPFMRVRDFVERIGLDSAQHRAGLATHGFKSLNKIITRPTGGFKSDAIKAQMEAFFRSIADEIERLAREEAGRLQRYFASMGVDQPDTAVVDIGWGASSLLAIQELVGRTRPGHQQLGYYFGTWKFAQPVLDHGCLLKSFFMHLEEPRSSCDLLTGTIEALEFIFTAPHGSVEGLKEVDGRIEPIEAALENGPDALENLRQMHEAGLAFVRDMLDSGAEPGMAEPIEGSYLQETLKRFLKNPTPAEAARFGQLQMRDSFGSQSRLRPLAAIPQARFFKSKAIEEGLDAAYWKNGYAALLRKQ